MFLSVCLIRLSPICVVSGVWLLHVSDSAVDGHLFQTSRQPSAALLGLGARYHCHVHQQVWYTHTHTPHTPGHEFAHILKKHVELHLPLYLKNIFPCFSIGGLILDKTVSDPNLAGIVVYTPVINGEICYSIQKYSIKLLLFVFLWNLRIVQHLSILENNSWRFGQYSA